MITEAEFVPLAMAPTTMQMGSSPSGTSFLKNKRISFKLKSSIPSKKTDIICDKHLVRLSFIHLPRVNNFAGAVAHQNFLAA